MAAYSSFDPLILLHEGTRQSQPVVCLPGAGATVTNLLDLADALGTGQSVYGLQPRGIEPGESPHPSVETAAQCNLAALERVGLIDSFHLIGHSHGGSVAFEMALRMQEAGVAPSSITLIDSRPPVRPGLASSVPTEREILTDYLDALERTFEGRLRIDRNTLENGAIEKTLAEARAVMVKKGILSARSHPQVLTGPYSTYAFARRLIYQPETVFSGKMGLILVRDASKSLEFDRVRKRDYTERWVACAPNSIIWEGPGNHYSALRKPHVDEIVARWREGIFR